MEKRESRMYKSYNARKRRTKRKALQSELLERRYEKRRKTKKRIQKLNRRTQR